MSKHVCHQINMAMIPIFLALAALLSSTAHARPSTPYNGASIKIPFLKALTSHGGYSVFLQSINNSRLYGPLHDMFSVAQYTVFVPSDAAFNKIPASQKATLFNNRQRLKDVMLMHFVRGNIMYYADLQNAQKNAQYKVDACNFTSTVDKTSAAGTTPSYQAYGGLVATIDTPDLWTRKMSAQGVDTLLIPGEGNCLSSAMASVLAATKAAGTATTATPAAGTTTTPNANANSGAATARRGGKRTRAPRTRRNRRSAEEVNTGRRRLLSTPAVATSGKGTSSTPKTTTTSSPAKKTTTPPVPVASVPAGKGRRAARNGKARRAGKARRHRLGGKGHLGGKGKHTRMAGTRRVGATASTQFGHRHLLSTSSAADATKTSTSKTTSTKTTTTTPSPAKKASTSPAYVPTSPVYSPTSNTGRRGKRSHRTRTAGKGKAGRMRRTRTRGAAGSRQKRNRHPGQPK